jgi:hypothetical protein
VPKVDFLYLTIGLLPLWEKFPTGAGVELYSIYVHVMRRLLANAERWLLANALTQATSASCSSPSHYRILGLR